MSFPRRFVRPGCLRHLCSLTLALAPLTGPGPAAAQRESGAGEAAPSSVAADSSCRISGTPMYVPASYLGAVARGTRDASGEPGRGYWQQRTDYHIEVEIDPATRLLTGRETIRYANNSPDTLPILAVRLYQNIFREDAKRLEVLPATEGILLDSLAVGGEALEVSDSDSSQTIRDGTLMALRLPQPILPGETRDVRFVWRFTIPPDASLRMGTVDSTSFFLAQWYPQIAVYDDLEGWAVGEYLGPGEFYNEYGDFDVSITVPAGFGVWGTGALQNPEATWSQEVGERARKAAASREVVHVLEEDDFGPGKATRGRRGERLTWRFRAENVRDFAFATGDHYLWDMTSAVLDSTPGVAGGGGEGGRREAHGRKAGAGRTATASAVYRPGAEGFGDVAEFARISLETFSGTYPGVPYPYPHMTVVEGGSGGMEYPMIVLDAATGDRNRTLEVTAHEIGHTWFPMLVGSNETVHGWQDEGLNTFITFWAQEAMGYEPSPRGENLMQYAFIAGHELEVPILTPANMFSITGPWYGIAAYVKPAVALMTLRSALTPEVFDRAFREYVRRWTNRHPSPWDFFNTMEHVAGRDLDWFWEDWFLGRGVLDQALADVQSEGDSVEVVVLNEGQLAAPADLEIRTAGGGEPMRARIPATAWSCGSRQAITVHARGKVESVTLNPDLSYPDVDPSDNRWPAESPAGEAPQPTPPGN
ncbi:MAG: M1 family metallopeptidase [Gemmatimonadetes bacterium]|nr:M1 family metallopeptidase [Gemmatimonadota bacterium]